MAPPGGGTGSNKRRRVDSTATATTSPRSTPSTSHSTTLDSTMRSPPPPSPSLRSSTHSTTDPANNSTTQSTSRLTASHPPSSTGSSSTTTPRAQRPKLTHSDSGSSSHINKGDVILLEGYRDVRVFSIHYDDVVVCRAISIHRGDLKVILKLSLSAKPSVAAQFKAETMLLNALRDKGVSNVTKVLAREVGRLGTMLILADDDLFAFSERFLPSTRPPAPNWTDPSTLLTTLDLTIKLIRLLSSLHSLHIVHGSLRPTTISTSIFNEVHVHDFSCAFRTAGVGGLGEGEAGEGSAPIRERGMKEESLPYLAPECSGRVGKSADYRSDYYAIGATLFEILTGRPPFAEAEDALEIIHAHIARRPVMVDSLDESVPRELGLVVAKLLEKSPEERYQTSQGLIVDLEMVATLVRQRASPSTSLPSPSPPPPSPSSNSNPDFHPRRHRLRRALPTPPSFNNVRPRILCPFPPRFVREDQIKSPVPFFAISQALSNLFRQILSEPTPKLILWRRRISHALGKEGHVLADVLPTLENVFEPGWMDTLPPVPVLGAKESEERFRDCVLRVLKVFAREGRPLVLVFDDLQWSTPSDITFILSLLSSSPPDPHAPTTPSLDSSAPSSPKLAPPPPSSSTTTTTAAAPAPTAQASNQQPSSHPILLLCLYRDNEVTPTHIVSTLLLPSLPPPPQRLEILLEPLSLRNVMDFVGESLRTPEMVVAEQEGKSREKEKREMDPGIRTLSEVILSRTSGSPLFVAQLLKALNADGMFTFDFTLHRWVFDLDLIAFKSISTDVVELLLAQMMKFSPATRRALMIAACLGNEELSAETLARATGRTVGELEGDLREAVEEGMLVPVGEVEVDEGEEGEGETLKDGAGSRSRRASLAQVVEMEVDDEGGDAEEQARPRLPKKPLRTLSSGTPKMRVEFYRFFHDRCQQAAYALVPPSDRPQMHYQIGQRLVHSLSEEATYDRIFDLANQLNFGIDILSTTDERDELARYNYLAATKASKATAFEGARKYLQIAWDLLGNGGWVGRPELMGLVTEALVEVEYSLTDYPASQEYVRIFLDHSKDTVAKLRVYARSIRSASAMGDSTKAIEIGREGLAMVGVNLPDDTEEATKLAETIRHELGFTSESIAHLDDRPRMTDVVTCGAQQVMAALVPPIYFTRIDLLGSLSSLAARATHQHGLDDAGAFLFTLLAVLVHGIYGELEESLAYGTAAIRYFEKYGGTPLACPTYKVYSSHVAPWSMPIRATLPSFRKAIAYGIEYRDAEYVGFGCGELCSYSILCGVPLPEVSSNLERFTVLVRKFRHELSTLYIAVVHQSALCLTGRAADPSELEGEAFGLADYHICEEKQYSVTIHLFHMLKLMTAVFFGDLKRAKDSVKSGRLHIAGAQGLIYPVFFQLFEAITLYDEFSILTKEQLDTLAATNKTMGELALTQADNFCSLKLWLDAEAARASGDRQTALSLYDDAIAAALAVDYIHLAACMGERCAKMLNSPKLGAGYLIEARDLWSKWGCQPKVIAMTNEYPHLFPTVVPPSTPRAGSISSGSRDGPNGLDQASSLSAVDESNELLHHDDLDQTSSTHRDEVASSSHTTWTLDRPSKPKRTPSFGSHGSHSHSTGEGHDILSDSQHRESITGHSSEHMSRSHLATELDLRTVVSASSVISMELSVDGVVSKLLSLALRTAGAEMCLLVLDKGGTLCAEAIAKSTSSETQHLRRLDAIDVQPDRYPCSVINYVARSKAMVVNTLDALGESISDPYLNQQKPLSILCLALANQQRVIGVMYMENSQTRNAFTPDRLEILSLISGQAAATIEKARLVQDLKAANADLKRSQAALEGYNRNLEGTVADRTLELRHKNDLLQAEVAEKERAQAEMRSAKDIAESATAMKSQFLANMSHEIRTPFNAVVALAGLLLDTSLNPVQTDYVETIKNSSQELLVVINDILDYSKIELDHLELSKDTVQLRNVLESSMDMLAERAATKSVEMALVIEQGDINIVGDLTRLRQIVVNLLSNAVKFTQDGEIIVTARSEPIARKSEAGEDMCRVTIAVKDSGIGIAKEHFGRLFRVFSQAEGSATTKQFGGTGLGLAISRKLSLLMGGDIELESEVGKGSTFTVTLNVPTAESPEVDLYAAAQNPDLVGKKCLIVDENVTSRLVLQQLVSSFGLVPDAPVDVSNAYGAAVAAHEAGQPHHVIIIDVFLPGFAAQILLRRLRQKEINTPVIALTRMGSPIYEEMRQLDCKFLIKPIKRNRLHHTLRQVFPASEFRKATPPPTTTSPFPTNQAQRAPLSILCAEDNPINVKVITHLLKRIGYTTDIAEDGLIALEKVQKKRYDIIFMDVNMPRMDGLEATREICKLMPDPAQRPMIVCLTANAMSGDKEMCIAAGGDGYVSKPILVPALLEALNAAAAKVQKQRAALGLPSSDQDSSSVPSAGTAAPAPTMPNLTGSGSFELELPATRLGRLSRAGSHSSKGSASRSAGSSPSRSPDPSYRTVSDGGAPSSA
ncbi:hypothetical protein BCR35DRAFT_311761 [Leucosporidium creatinivorum]|uniref:histidine kinase n=1 Tax=Leucosporidium creatinivorum TaxID=106004 RepID=A0A1Y2G621_9BASI|nr:hypothetical protein BCR35DRAFT_311761 [Leucosporidium creatinivorum]